jgi:hypothetical protein
MFIRIGGPPDKDYEFIGTVSCEKCGREFKVSVTAGEMPPTDAIEQAKRRIADSCPNHPGTDLLGPF